MYKKYGNTFRALAQHFPALQKKYDFIKTEVFHGKEFVGGDIPTNIYAREWDSTKIVEKK